MFFGDCDDGTYGLPVRLGGLATAEVAQGPCSVPQHAQLAAVTKQVDKRAKSASLQDKVTAGRAVTGNVSKGPDGLLAHIGLVAAQELDEDGDGAGLDDDLGLLCGPGGDVGKCPCGLELDECVWRSEELDEAAHDTGLDDLLDGRVALLGQQLAELGRGLDLLVDLLGKDALDHLGELLLQLQGFVSRQSGSKHLRRK